MANGGDCHLSLRARRSLGLAVRNSGLWLPRLVSAFTSESVIDLVLEELNLGALGELAKTQTHFH